MSLQFTDDDIGKDVVNDAGDEVGMIVDVDHGTAHVEPDPGITDSIKAALGWTDSGEDTYPLQEAAVGHITDDAIHLEGDRSSGRSAGTGGATDADPDRGIDRDGDDISGTDDERAVRRDDDDPLMGDDEDEGLIGDDDDDEELLSDDDDDRAGSTR
ncbi:hypothetical protein A6E15_09465 [Natrinema saccharevitans]|uniref:Uncharacterized protein n=1 Tax=Natrinema saccharevitans TaxID=301967 RepID=A0A1S8AWN2_9EURY|nr:hypothetical protein [Natrinema saccharevitans]OLZ41200.1 hypothetical protein A6E15_09465 [Natrinema saccharevitans]